MQHIQRESCSCWKTFVLPLPISFISSISFQSVIHIGTHLYCLVLALGCPLKALKRKHLLTDYKKNHCCPSLRKQGLRLSGMEGVTLNYLSLSWETRVMLQDDLLLLSVGWELSHVLSLFGPHPPPTSRNNGLKAQCYIINGPNDIPLIDKIGCILF